MIRLYMDEHVRFEITFGLRNRGVDALTVQEDRMTSAPDSDVLDRAGELDRVLFTNDQDLVIEAAVRQRNGRQFTGIVYANPMDVTIGNCIAPGTHCEPHRARRIAKPSLAAATLAWHASALTAPTSCDRI
jgi:hypothetical protein